jgi:4-hydroxy-2-oxoheptanedioate aldolase
MGSFLKRDLAASKRMKAKLRANEVAILMHSSHSAPSMVERLAENGFDAVLIDAEHASVGRDRVEEMSRAAALAGTAAIIRPEGSLPHLITGYLGCGVDGFMLPLIRSRAHAQELVDQFRFSAPLDFPDRPLILMIELIDAVDSLPELMRIEGVDAFLVAPGDLALSMGEDLTGGKPISPRVAATIDRAVATIVDAGKTCGARVEFDDVDRFIEKGVRLIYYHADLLLARGARDFHAKVESARRDDPLRLATA